MRESRPGRLRHQKNKKGFGPRFAKEVGMGNPAEKTIRNPNLVALLLKAQTAVNKFFILSQRFLPMAEFNARENVCAMANDVTRAGINASLDPHLNSA